MPHILAALSSHGFGHLAQAAPVLNALRARLPGMRLTLRTALSREVLAKRIEGEFALQAVADDFGMVQHDALEVDIPASMARYRELHLGWKQRVEQVAGELTAAAPDLVFADVPYLTLAAASRAGIPAAAMCCLNWLDIFRHYSDGIPGAEAIAAQMREAYNSAALFLCTEPAMPMPELDNLRDIGVVAVPAASRRCELEAAGCIRPGEWLLLVAMGGIAHRLPLERWPQYRGVRYAVPQAWGIRREDCLEIEGLGLSFSELLASCDAVLTKPGYGTFTEAAVNGIPVLYIPRKDWPEQPYLIDWLRQHGQCQEVPAAQLARGEIAPLLEVLPRPGSFPAVQAAGVTMAVDALLQVLIAAKRGTGQKDV